jgi:site-specific DNA-methyltransferase (adenine-specific)
MRMVPIGDVQPYENNPRTITDADVERVRSSIERYGYQNPIIVDTDLVIIVGHTRYRALQKLDYAEILVIVSDLPPEKALEYRIVDNRAGELATWNQDLLIPELREFTTEHHLSMFFPDIDLSLGFTDESYLIDDEDLAAAQAALSARMRDDRDLGTREIACPSCQRTFTIST